ncbi:hypothetical protein ON010_g7232 [Phytophthora cinnamomi]|nr:hypothetical protein ON010_g7232 [Phytophthora cinnamomi]
MVVFQNTDNCALPFCGVEWILKSVKLKKRQPEHEYLVYKDSPGAGSLQAAFSRTAPAKNAASHPFPSTIESSNSLFTCAAHIDLKPVLDSARREANRTKRHRLAALRPAVGRNLLAGRQLDASLGGHGGVGHALLDLSSHHHEGLFDVGGVLRTGLQELDAQALGELLGGVRAHDTLGRQIALVTDKQLVHVLAGVSANHSRTIRLLNGADRGRPCLGTHKVHANGRDVALRIRVVGETQQQTRLADARVTDQQQLEQVVTVAEERKREALSVRLLLVTAAPLVRPPPTEEHGREEKIEDPPAHFDQTARGRVASATEGEDAGGEHSAAAGAQRTPTQRARGGDARVPSVLGLCAASGCGVRVESAFGFPKNAEKERGPGSLAVFPEVLLHPARGFSLISANGAAFAHLCPITDLPFGPITDPSVAQETHSRLNGLGLISPNGALDVEGDMPPLLVLASAAAGVARQSRDREQPMEPRQRGCQRPTSVAPRLPSAKYTPRKPKRGLMALMQLKSDGACCGALAWPANLLRSGGVMLASHAGPLAIAYSTDFRDSFWFNQSDDLVLGFLAPVWRQLRVVLEDLIHTPTSTAADPGGAKGRIRVSIKRRIRIPIR